MLLETKISRDDGYQKQQDTLIVWTEHTGVDMALSFQEAEGCSQIWCVAPPNIPTLPMAVDSHQFTLYSCANTGSLSAKYNSALPRYIRVRIYAILSL